MSTRLVDDDLLQRFHDGDTTDDESSAVRAKLAESDEDRRALARLEKLSALFAEVAREDVERAGSELDGLYARVSAKVADAPRGKVVDLASRRRTRTVLPVAMLAAAALLLVVFLAHPFGPDTTVPEHPTQHETPVTPPDIHAALLGSRVVAEDFGDGAGTVFSVPGEGGAAVAVVWVSDDTGTP